MLNAAAINLLSAYRNYALALCAEQPNTEEVQSKKNAVLAQCAEGQTPQTIGQLVWNAYAGTTVRRGTDRESLIATATEAIGEIMQRQPTILDIAIPPSRVTPEKFARYVACVRKSVTAAAPA